MILADTSAWVEYDRATGSAVDLRLRDLIAADGPIAVTEPVIMEMPLESVRQRLRDIIQHKVELPRIGQEAQLPGGK